MKLKRKKKQYYKLLGLFFLDDEQPFSVEDEELEDAQECTYFSMAIDLKKYRGKKRRKTCVWKNVVKVET